MENDVLDFKKILEIIKYDDTARQSLIQYYMPKVDDIARLYTGQGVDDEDLKGEGYLALCEGVSALSENDNADEAEGMLIKGVMDAMEALIRESFEEHEKDKQLAEKVNIVADKAREIAGDFGRKVTVDEIMEFGDLSEELIRDAIRISSKSIEDIDYGE